MNSMEEESTKTRRIGANTLRWSVVWCWEEIWFGEELFNWMEVWMLLSDLSKREARWKRTEPPQGTTWDCAHNTRFQRFPTRKNKSNCSTVRGRINPQNGMVNGQETAFIWGNAPFIVTSEERPLGYSNNSCEKRSVVKLKSLREWTVTRLCFQSLRNSALIIDLTGHPIVVTHFACCSMCTIHQRRTREIASFRPRITVPYIQASLKIHQLMI